MGNDLLEIYAAIIIQVGLTFGKIFSHPHAKQDVNRKDFFLQDDDDETIISTGGDFGSTNSNKIFINHINEMR